MRTISMIRKVDELGRIVIPVELRHMMEMDCGQAVELSVQGQTLILRRFEPGCVFCGGLDRLVTMEGRNICLCCRKKLAATI